MNNTNFPEHWKIARLGDVCNIVMGQSPPSTTYNGEGIGMPFLQGKAEFTELFPMPTKYCTKQLRISPEGSVLMSVRAPVGDVNVADRKYIIGRGLTSISLKNGNNRFLFYLLLHNKKELQAKSSGSTFKSINKTTINDFSIPLPPLPEQRAIAHVLQTIQEAKFSRQREIVLERERKAALMDYLFSHGTKDEPRKQTEIGEIPESWMIHPFEACLKKVKSKKVPSIPKRDYKESGRFPIIDQGASFIAGWTDSAESVISNNLPVVIFGDHTRIFKYIDFPFALGADGTKLLYSNNDILDSRFFYHYLLSLKVPDKGYNRHYRYLREFSVVGPTFPEQHFIARILQAIDEKTAALEQEVELIDELFRAMLDELMTGQRSAVPLIDTVLPN